MCAVDIRDPFRRREVGHFIPRVTPGADRRCIDVAGVPRCNVVLQTNNVEADERRANTGLHIVEPMGPARGGS